MRPKKEYINRVYKGVDQNGNEFAVELSTAEGNDRQKYRSYFVINGKKFEYSMHSTIRDAENFWMLMETLIKMKGKEDEQDSN